MGGKLGTIRRKLDAIDNRSQQRPRPGYTPAEERRREVLYARLHELDWIADVPAMVATRGAR
jgi:hypothetical protein